MTRYEETIKMNLAKDQLDAKVKEAIQEFMRETGMRVKDMRVTYHTHHDRYTIPQTYHILKDVEYVIEF